MSHLLALDCSNRWTGIALSSDEKVIYESGWDLGRQQASLIPILVEDSLKVFGLTANQLDSLAVTVGPGYFTGIRIGMAYIASLAEALNLKVVPISSLEALAWSSQKSLSSDEKIVISCIKASRTSVYSAGFNLNSGEVVMAVEERPLDALFEEVNTLNSASIDILFTDRSMLDKMLDLSEGRENNISICLVDAINPSAIASLGNQNLKKACCPEELRARYYRAPAIGGC